MQFIGTRGGDEMTHERAASASASAGPPDSQPDLSDDDIPF
jgi:hypothetical protein